MSFRIVYIILLFFIAMGASSCRSKRGPKEYIEKNGLHSDKKPREMAAEIGKQQKKQQKAYDKDMKKRYKRKARTGRVGKE